VGNSKAWCATRYSTWPIFVLALY